MHLPLAWPSKECEKAPLFLAFQGSHFVSLCHHDRVCPHILPYTYYNAYVHILRIYVYSLYTAYVYSLYATHICMFFIYYSAYTYMHLPMAWPSRECEKAPLFLAFQGSHFVSLCHHDRVCPHILPRVYVYTYIYYNAYMYILYILQRIYVYSMTPPRRC